MLISQEEDSTNLEKRTSSFETMFHNKKSLFFIKFNEFITNQEDSEFNNEIKKIF